MISIIQDGEVLDILANACNEILKNTKEGFEKRNEELLGIIITELSYFALKRENEIMDELDNAE